MSSNSEFENRFVYFNFNFIIIIIIIILGWGGRGLGSFGLACCSSYSFCNVFLFY